MTNVEKGKPLTGEGLFRLVCDEAFKDGIIEDFENKLMQVLASFLGIEASRAIELATHAKERFEAGQLGDKRPLSPAVLYEKALYFICSDGEIDDEEQRMLEGLRKLFRVSDNAHEKLLERMRGQFVSADEHDPTALLDEVADGLVANLEQGDWNKCAKGLRQYRKLARRIAVSSSSNAYLAGASRVVQAASQIHDEFNKQKFLIEAMGLLNVFCDRHLDNATAAANYSYACRSLIIALQRANAKEQAVTLIKRQFDVFERHGKDDSVLRAICAVALECLRSTNDDGSRSDISGVEDELASLLVTMRKALPNSDSITHACTRFEESTGRRLD